MPETFLIGLDFGSESARGVLIDVRTGRQAAYHVHPYRHGIMTERCPAGDHCPPGSLCKTPPTISKPPKPS